MQLCRVKANLYEEEEVALTIDASWGRMAMACGLMAMTPSRTQTETFHVSAAWL